MTPQELSTLKNVVDKTSSDFEIVADLLGRHAAGVVGLTPVEAEQCRDMLMRAKDGLEAVAPSLTREIAAAPHSRKK